MNKNISIITISLNNIKGLEETILSVIHQTDRECCEYIVIDGNSTDGTVELLAEYSSKIDKIIIENDRGIFDAMNKGIKNACGRYIHFLNSGDVFTDTNVLEKVNTVIDLKYNIYCGDVNIYVNHEFIRKANVYPWLPHQGVFMSTHLLKEYMFDTELKIFGDLDLWTRLKKDDRLNVEKLNFSIANMEMDGVGNNPKFFIKRWKDKKVFYKKHKINSMAHIFVFIAECFHFLIYKILGMKFYWNKYLIMRMKIKYILVKTWSNPFIAINRLINILYSSLLYPIRFCIYKKIGLGTKIHPLASINNFTNVSIGKHSEINRNVNIWTTQIIIGDYVQINPGTSIYGKVIIGNYVMIGPNCMITGGSHQFKLTDVPMRFQQSTEKEIRIEDDVWIGANCVILEGVVVGKGSIIGAGSIVNKNIPEYSIAVGNPVDIKKRRK
jgi:acetyltransferase-like isoleucine patch superfamily enzyme